MYDKDSPQNVEAQATSSRDIHTFPDFGKPPEEVDVPMASALSRVHGLLKDLNWLLQDRLDHHRRAESTMKAKQDLELHNQQLQQEADHAKKQMATMQHEMDAMRSSIQSYQQMASTLQQAQKHYDVQLQAEKHAKST